MLLPFSSDGKNENKYSSMTSDPTGTFVSQVKYLEWGKIPSWENPFLVNTYHKSCPRDL